MEKNVDLVDKFLDTGKGKDLLGARATAYMKANPGLSQNRAEQEAITDIVQRNEENMKRKILDEFRVKRIDYRNNICIKKLQTVQELMKLEAEYKNFIANYKHPRNVAVALQEIDKSDQFDTDLVGSMRKEPWYLVARHTVEKLKTQQQPAAG